MSPESKKSMACPSSQSISVIRMMRKKAVLSVAVVLLAVIVRRYGFPGKKLAPIVATSHGLLQGVVSTSRDGREYNSYLGIPYAKPPVGELRFEPPEQVEKWSGVRDATQFGPRCIQLDLMANQFVGEESCLFVNIFTPTKHGDSKRDPSALLPVMFFIHGGLFIFGAGDMYRPDYFMDLDVVFVTVNYRLASFGFINSGDGVLRGNQGLKDQSLALKFIQENIHHFGGDSKRVTIFGESAGAASVHAHVLSPMSKGLFSKAISQSGLATNPWALTNDPVSQSKKFAVNLGCPTDTTKEMVACLKNLTASEVVKGHQVVSDPLRQLIDVFVPTIELPIPDGNTFLSEHPMTILKKGAINKVPSIIGFNADEGLLNSAVIARNETLIESLRQDMNKFLPRLLYLEDNTNVSVISRLRDYYFLSTSKAESLSDFKNYTSMFTDRFWLMDLHKAVTYQTKLAPVYLYYYTYQTEFTLTDIVLAMKGELHPLLELIGLTLKNMVRKYIFWENLPNFGICHSDELSLQFYMPLLAKVSPSHRDYEMSRELVKLWVQFAKADVDTKRDNLEDLEFLGHSWPPQDPNQPLKYFQLDVEPQLVSQPYIDRIQFWNSLGVAKH